MGKLKMFYQNNTLYITMSGAYSNRSIKSLKKKMYNIVDQYGVSDIIINKKDTTNINGEAFYDMLDEYDDKYGGNLIVEE